jgi:hypothetical protein
MFLLYIAMGIAAMVLSSPMAGGGDVAAKLAAIAEHAPRMRLAIVLTQLIIVDALVLAVALYALTRDYDRDLALLALTFRVAEGVIGAICLLGTLGLFWLATASAASAPDAAATNAIAAVLLKVEGWSPILGAFPFSVGSALYSWLFLRSRSIPTPLGWLGVFASILLVVLLPAQLAGFLEGPVTGFMWLPMLVFEVGLARWLLIKGVTTPPTLSPTVNI